MSDSEPIPVVITAPLPNEPMPVVIAGPSPVVVTMDPASEPTAPRPGVPAETRTRFQVQKQAIDPSKPATTTFQQDLTSAGQRHINVMWEGTQRLIALMVTGGTLMICIWLVCWPTVPTELRLLAFTLLSNVFFLVIGTYFQRTNHTKTGGVGRGEVGR